MEPGIVPKKDRCRGTFFWWLKAGGVHDVRIHVVRYTFTSICRKNFKSRTAFKNPKIRSQTAVIYLNNFP
jgi:hypothetical protein